MSNPLKYILGTLLALACALSLLAFGNPQWHKVVYMFQAYVWPAKRHDDLIELTMFPSRASYTGTWRDWDRQGGLLKEAEYLKGHLNGLTRIYYPSGELEREWLYKDGLMHGTQKKFSKNGQLISKQSYKNDKPDGLSFNYSDTGQLGIIRLWEGLKTTTVYDPSKKIDRRAEFGIDVE